MSTEKLHPDTLDTTEEGDNKKENEDNSIREIVRHFTAETTFHGLKYIAEETRYISRRIAWIIIVISVIIIFTYAIVSRLLYFYKYPSNIELEVKYLSKVPFPTVTLCNQNPYRLTALQRVGMYDLMTETYDILQTVDDNNDTAQPDVTCQDTFVLNPVICEIPSGVIYRQYVNETTVTVCKKLCLDHVGDKCSGVLYNRHSRKCTLTSYTGEGHWYSNEDISQRRNLCLKKKIHFYRRRRCLDENDIKCTFEEEETSSTDMYSSVCRFTNSDEADENWNRVQANRDTGDITYGNGQGHYMYLLETQRRWGYKARLQSGYLNTTGKCMFLFANLLGQANNELRVLTQAESQAETVIRAIKNEDLSSFKMKYDSYWFRWFITLPDGIHRIIVEAERTDSKIGGFALDEMEISTCKKIKRNCKSSSHGKNYMGYSNQSAVRGDVCLPWSSIYPGLSAFPIIPDPSMDSAFNYCRFVPKYDEIGCYIDGTVSFAACEIPACPCDPVQEFTCASGYCIPISKRCDGTPHCVDGSDEGEVCDSYRSISCEFQNDFKCGYRQHNHKEQLTWEIEFNENAQVLHLHQEDIVTPGTTAYIESPTVNYILTKGITIRLRSLKSHGNAIHVWLRGSYGVSRGFLLRHDDGMDMNLGNVNWTTTHRVDNADVEESSEWWSTYDVCIPGGIGVVQSVIIEAIVNNKDDDFQVAEISNDERPCSMDTEVFNAMFPTTNIDCDFNSGKCEWTEMSDNIYMEWNVIPSETAIGSMTLYSINNVRGTECNFCLIDPETQQSLNYIFFETSGFVQSNGHPSLYTNNLYSSWLIQMPEGYTITLNFLAFDIEKSSTCHYDFLQIMDITANSTTAHAEQPVRYCGSLNDVSTFTSTGNVIHLYFYSDYTVRGKGFRLSYTGVTASPADNAIGLVYNGDYTDYTFASRLLTPILDSEHNYCLSFDYAKITNFFVYLVSKHGTETLIFQDLSNGTLPNWSRMSININKNMLDSSYLEFVGQKNYDSKIQYYALLDNVQTTQDFCKTAAMPVFEGNMSCSFNEVNQCGFIDKSITSNKWTRVLTNTSLGMQFHGYLSFIRGELLSPKMLLEDAGCLNLQLSYIGSPCIEIKLYPDDTYSSYTNVEYGCLPSNVNLTAVTASIDLETGSFFAGIIAEGVRDFSVLLTHLHLDPSPCPEPITTETPEIPTTQVADMVTTEAITVNPTITEEEMDEEDSNGEGETPTNNLNTTGLTYVTDLYMDDSEAYDMIVSSLDIQLAEFLRNVTHQQYNFLLSCYWDGNICENHLINETVTDLGSCVTFNADKSDQLYSKRSGSQFGLQMTLNIEDYEHVPGIGTDSGIKVHFDSPDKIPLMKNKGYAVSPGTHSLFSLYYTESTFLEPRYGTCGSVDLHSYPGLSYTTSHCWTQCETYTLDKKCNCVLPYMSDVNVSSTGCSLKQFLTCVIPEPENMTQTDNTTGCYCPDSCNDVIYDTKQSSSSLSGLALDSILRKNKNDVHDQFKYGMEIQNRLNSDDFMKVVSTLKTLTTTVNSLVDYIDSDTDQIINLVKLSLESILGITREDLTESSVTITHYQEIYNTYMKAERETFSNKFVNLESRVNDLAQYVKWKHHPCVYSYHNSDINRLQNEKDWFMGNISSVKDFLHAYIELYKYDLVNREQVSTDPEDFSVFPNYSNPGFSWAHNTLFPIKTVISEHLFTFCHDFSNSTWSNFLANLNKFDELLNASFLNYDQSSSCSYFRDKVLNYTSVASSTTTSGTNIGSPPSFSTTFATGSTTTPYSSNTPPLSASSTYSSTPSYSTTPPYSTTPSYSTSTAPFASSAMYNGYSTTNFYNDNSESTSTAPPSVNVNDSFSDIDYTLPTGPIQLKSRGHPIDTRSPTANRGVFDYLTAVDVFRNLSATLRNISLNMNGCLNEYGNFLDDSVEWAKQAKSNLPSNDLNGLSSTGDQLLELTKWLDKLYVLYARDKISKQQLAESLLQKNDSLFTLSNLKDWMLSFRNQLTQDVITNNFPNLDSMKLQLYQNYKRIIDNYESFTEYTGGQSLDIDLEMKDIKMFRKPRPRIENSYLITYLLTANNVAAMMSTDVSGYIRNHGLTAMKDAFDGYFKEIKTLLRNHISTYDKLQIQLETTVTELETILSTYTSDIAIGEDFIRNNLMQVDVYFGELKFTKTKQNVAYTLSDFFGDLGGYLGLLLGASVVTVCEVLDLIIYQIARLHFKRKERLRKESIIQNENSQKYQKGDIPVKKKMPDWLVPNRSITPVSD